MIIILTYVALIILAIFISDFVFKSNINLSKELERKVGHIGFGVIAMSAPFMMDAKWEFIVITLYLSMWFVVIRIHPYFKGGLYDVIHLKSRKTSGDILFVIAVLIMWIFIQNSVLYLVLVGVITLADSTASLVGRLFPIQKYKIAGSTKSIGGSLSFLIVTLAIFLVSHQFLPYSVTRFLLAALAATFAEAASGYGLDNITIPVAIFIFLH